MSQLPCIVRARVALQGTQPKNCTPIILANCVRWANYTVSGKQSEYSRHNVDTNSDLAS